MLRRFNLSEWALAHQSLVLYLMLVLALVGVGSYLRLGQAEDPDFTFKLMVVRTGWPGASAEEVERQVTDKIERKLQETPRLDFLRSYSKPGESVVFVFVKDSSRPDEIKDTWYQVRKKIGDIRNTLPQGIQGPFFNDEFGDTFGNIYALTGEGYSYAQLKETADRIRNQLLRVKSVAKVDLIGEQDEKIYVELGNAVSMVPRGDIIALGHALDDEIARIEKELPVGLELDRVNDQPATVKRSVREFTRSLTEAVAIVLIVSFLSLGLRTGLIVALSIPLTLAVTFLFMYLTGIDLHKISLGALIIALGLLVG